MTSIMPTDSLSQALMKQVVMLGRPTWQGTENSPKATTNKELRSLVQQPKEELNSTKNHGVNLVVDKLPSQALHPG
jgi:hypothetical protein